MKSSVQFWFCLKCHGGTRLYKEDLDTFFSNARNRLKMASHRNLAGFLAWRMKPVPWLWSMGHMSFSMREYIKSELIHGNEYWHETEIEIYLKIYHQIIVYFDSFSRHKEACKSVVLCSSCRQCHHLLTAFLHKIATDFIWFWLLCIPSFYNMASTVS